MEITTEEQQYIDSMVERSHEAGIRLRDVDTKAKNQALIVLAGLIDENREAIKKTNIQDVEEATKQGLSEAMVSRLVLDNKEIDLMIQSLREIAALNDPVGEIVMGKTLPNGLQLRKVRVPIGVIAVIYESRPNVTVDVGALGLKSSNAIILRGGKEAINSNKILASLFQNALSEVGLPSNAVQLFDRTSRHLMDALMKKEKEVDLIVPRGGEGLIRYVTENSRVPVIKHDKGVCHVYIDKSASPQKAEAIIDNAKTQKPGVCNAAETLLIDKEYLHGAQLLSFLQERGVSLHADNETSDFFNSINFEPLTEEGYDHEYLSLDLSVRVVDGLAGAIEHINRYTSYHSEAVVAEDYTVTRTFLQKLDSAALFVNASTRFHDGGQFGFGAEVGISTGKLHSRGPMGLQDLTSTKFIVEGNGHIRT